MIARQLDASYSAPGAARLRLLAVVWAVLALFAAALLPVDFASDRLHAAKPALVAPPRSRFSDADVVRLAELIDRYVTQRWKQAGVAPAPEASDAEFVRRAYLDAIGRIPHVAEVRTFFESRRPNKRFELVRELSATKARFVAHWASVWRAAMLPETDGDYQLSYYRPGFEAWLRKQLLEDEPYDHWVRELITYTPSTESNPYGQLLFFGQTGGASPAAFYQAKEFKPENLAAAVSRVFLGTRIECAQCHRHPFADWDRPDFWGLAAFFQGTDQASPQRGGVRGVIEELFTFPEIEIPGTGKVVPARFLDGQKPRLAGRATYRVTLAQWMTAPENPFLAKATVNRLWAHFFGTGMVDPPDDFAKGNPASHPELLDALGREFVEHDFDLKFIIRGIMSSRTYQLSSRTVKERSHGRQTVDARSSENTATHDAPSSETSAAPQLFARAAVRGLTGEQLYDSIATATGYRDESGGAVNPFFFGLDGSPRQAFLSKFKTGSENPTERQTSIVQALTLMNGEVVASATSLETSELLAGVINYPLFSDADRLETLFLAALSRPPTPRELATFAAYVRGGGPEKNSTAALADVFWALLNSSEFASNH